jgi:predicted transposase YbfD/YdcC
LVDEGGDDFGLQRLRARLARLMNGDIRRPKRVAHEFGPGLLVELDQTLEFAQDIEWLVNQHQWPGLAAIGKVERTRETLNKTTCETAYYLLSAPLTPERFNAVVRSHWGIENRLHWRLDVVMNEDQDRSRLGHGPHNLAVLRHMAVNVMQKDGEKGSLRGKNKRAGWDDAYLARLMTLF